MNDNNLDKKKKPFENDSKAPKIRLLSSMVLFEFLKKKRISVTIAKRMCKEFSFIYNENKHIVLAIANVSGGYEIRNDSISGCIGPKDISYIRNSKNEIVTTCCVFDDFIDYLSYLTISNSKLINLRKQDYLILNSTEQLDFAIDILSKYNCIYCYFNDDKGGSTKHRFVLKLRSSKVNDASIYYRDTKSLRDNLNMYMHHYPNEQPKRGRGRR